MSHPEPERREHAPPGSSLLAGLTPDQAKAVTYGTGPLLLIAGPGAGKTRTLTHRIAYRLESEQARPDQILAVTFSVRAAGELRLRLADLLGQQRARGVTAATFHSVCARLLREHAQFFGRTDGYTIYDQGDMRRVLDWLLADKDRPAVQAALSAGGQPALAEIQSALSLAKSELLTRHPAGSLDIFPYGYMIPGVARAATTTDAFNAVAEPRRRAILDRLAGGERSVNELVELLGVAQPQVSKHLRVLREVGAVQVRDVGRQRLYRLNGQALKPIHDWVSNYERLWSDRFDELDVVLEELKRKEQGDGSDE